MSQQDSSGWVPVLWAHIITACLPKRGSLSLSMGVLTSQKSSETFLSWSQPLVNASLCMHNIVLPLQALSDSGAKDNLIKEVLAKQLGCILEYLDKPIPAFAKVFRVVTTIMCYPWLSDPITLWQIGHWEKFVWSTHYHVFCQKSALSSEDIPGFHPTVENSSSELAMFLLKIWTLVWQSITGECLLFHLTAPMSVP